MVHTTFTYSPSNSASIFGRGTLSRLFGDEAFGSLNVSWPIGGGLTFDEKTQAYTAELDLAGYKRDDINVEVLDEVVTVIAANDKRGRVSKTYWAPDVDEGKVEAQLEDGVLSLRLPVIPAAKARKINVR